MSNNAIRDKNYEELLADKPLGTAWCLRTRITMPVLESMFVEIGRVIYNPDMMIPKYVRPIDGSDCPLGINVIPSGDWNPDMSDKLPLVTVDVGSMRYTKIEGYEGVAQYDLENGRKIFVRNVVTSVVFQHLGKNKMQCMLYAAHSHDMLDAFSYAIKKHFRFENFLISSIVKPAYRDKYKDWESLVQADIQFRETFSLIEESQELKTVALKYK